MVILQKDFLAMLKKLKEQRPKINIGNK